MSGSGVSPFIHKPICCPACNENSEQPHFRMRMYVEGERESDGHVIDFKWLADNAAPVHPPYYFVYFCRHCFYSDVTGDYSRPVDNEHVPSVLRAFKRAPDREKAVIALLAKHIEYEDLQFESAMLLHLLAAYIQMLTPPSEMDNLKLARLLLRIAWLYREHAPSEGGAVQGTPEKGILDALGDFESALHRARENWLKASVHLDKQLERGDSPESNACRQHRGNIEKLMETQIAEVFRLKRLLKEGTLGPGGSGDGFDGDSGLRKLMVSIKSVWPMAPSDENEAMRSSLRFLQQAIQTDPAFDNAQTYLNGISLIVDLLIRCNDLDAAFETVRGIYRGAAEARSKVMDELKAKDIDETAKQRLLGKIRKLSRSIEHAGEIRTKLIGLLALRDQDLIRKVLIENAGASAAKVMTALEQNGIVPAVITYLNDRGDLEPAKTKALRDA